MLFGLGRARGFAGSASSGRSWIMRSWAICSQFTGAQVSAATVTMPRAAITHDPGLSRPLGSADALACLLRGVGSYMRVASTSW